MLAPAVLWGPYLWTDGVKPRKSDNLVWLKEDVTTKDGTHPSNSGREKVAEPAARLRPEGPAGQLLVPGRWPSIFQLTDFPQTNRSSHR